MSPGVGDELIEREVARLRRVRLGGREAIVGVKPPGDAEEVAGALRISDDKMGKELDWTGGR